MVCIRKYMTALSSKHRLTVFAKASEALAYAEINPIDLFILDIQLLDYRGTELAKQLRSISKYRFTPILFTTELAGEELTAYRDVKCYDFLVKSFNELALPKRFARPLKWEGGWERRPPYSK